MFINLGRIFMDDTLYPIQCYIGIIDQPFPVCIFENIIERPVHPAGRSVFSAAIIVIGHVKILSVKSLLVLNSLINLD